MCSRATGRLREGEEEKGGSKVGREEDEQESKGEKSHCQSLAARSHFCTLTQPSMRMTFY